jgi:hypothetical protein
VAHFHPCPKTTLTLKFLSVIASDSEFSLYQNAHIPSCQWSIIIDAYSHVMPGMEEEAARQIDEALNLTFAESS